MNREQAPGDEKKFSDLDPGIDLVSRSRRETYRRQQELGHFASPLEQNVLEVLPVLEPPIRPRLRNMNEEEWRD